jgi:hypothetical protein
MAISGLFRVRTELFELTVVPALAPHLVQMHCEFSYCRRKLDGLHHLEVESRMVRHFKDDPELLARSIEGRTSRDSLPRFTSIMSSRGYRHLRDLRPRRMATWKNLLSHCG